ncbi:hypothetical protein [Ensifer canadensis]|uniref:hypothetical protein n=1 Tax=Ensifer canadensis TaxID=555315 RepID=UPI0035E3E9F5
MKLDNVKASSAQRLSSHAHPVEMAAFEPATFWLEAGELPRCYTPTSELKTNPAAPVYKVRVNTLRRSSYEQKHRYWRHCRRRRNHPCRCLPTSWQDDHNGNSDTASDYD